MFKPNQTFFMKLKHFPACIACVCIGVAVVVACNKTDSIRSTSNHSGEEIFRGLMFAEGEVALLVPQVKVGQIQAEDIFTNPKDLEMVHNVREQIIANLHSTDPVFFESFRREMTSKNPDRIKTAYAKGCEKIVNGIKTLNSVKSGRESLEFDIKVTKVSHELAALNKDGTLDKSATQARLKAMILENSAQKPIGAEVTPQCIAAVVVGVIVLVAVIAGAAVYAAVATDAYFWTTSSESTALTGVAQSKTPLFLEELYGQIAVAL